MPKVAAHTADFNASGVFFVAAFRDSRQPSYAAVFAICSVGFSLLTSTNLSNGTGVIRHQHLKDTKLRPIGPAKAKPNTTHTTTVSSNGLDELSVSASRLPNHNKRS